MKFQMDSSLHEIESDQFVETAMLPPMKPEPVVAKPESFFHKQEPLPCKPEPPVANLQPLHRKLEPPIHTSESFATPPKPPLRMPGAALPWIPTRSSHASRTIRFTSHPPDDVDLLECLLPESLDFIRMEDGMALS